jgi:hypothetical protein
VTLRTLRENVKVIVWPMPTLFGSCWNWSARWLNDPLGAARTVRFVASRVVPGSAATESDTVTPPTVAEENTEPTVNVSQSSTTVHEPAAAAGCTDSTVGMTQPRVPATAARRRNSRRPVPVDPPGPPGLRSYTRGCSAPGSPHLRGEIGQPQPSHSPMRISTSHPMRRSDTHRQQNV